MDDRIEKTLEYFGFEITSKETTVGGMTIVNATKNDTGREPMQVSWGTNGTMRVIKPNGTVKWYYEKTEAQNRATIKQTLEFYK